jgi:hypothetical protein
MPPNLEVKFGEFRSIFPLNRERAKAETGSLMTASTASYGQIIEGNQPGKDWALSCTDFCTGFSQPLARQRGGFPFGLGKMLAGAGGAYCRKQVSCR